MTEEELNKQRSLVDEVLKAQDDETLDEWISYTEEDFWDGLIYRNYLSDLLALLKAKGVNTDSIEVMSYVDVYLSSL